MSYNLQHPLSLLFNSIGDEVEYDYKRNAV